VRQYLTQNADVSGFDGKSVAGMDFPLVRPIGNGRVVLLRQRLGSLPAGPDGLVAVLLNGVWVLRMTSSLARDTRAPERATLPMADARCAPPARRRAAPPANSDRSTSPAPGNR
jgi:extracellular elastinolytic metalloproteinase